MMGVVSTPAVSEARVVSLDDECSVCSSCE
jgi:hypothetical protein